MSRKTREEVLQRIGYHYRRATTKGEKSRLLSALCATCGWERKYTIKQVGRLNRRHVGVPKGRHGGARPRYGPEVVGLLKALWLASDQLCGKRLAPMLPLWLVSWEKRHGRVDEALRRKLCQISPAQIDRLLRSSKSARARRSRQANEVRRQVPLRTGPWEESAPGWIEADTVAHGGESLRGPHAWSLVFTDIATGWSEARLCWTRSDLAIHERVGEIESQLPPPPRLRHRQRRRVYQRHAAALLEPAGAPCAGDPFASVSQKRQRARGAKEPGVDPGDPWL